MRGNLERIGAAVFCLLGLIALGFAGGGFLGGRVLARNSVGWDALSNVLGGAMVGILVGIAAFVVLLGRVTTRTLVWTGSAGLGGAVLLVVVLQALKP